MNGAQTPHSASLMRRSVCARSFPQGCGQFLFIPSTGEIMRGAVDRLGDLIARANQPEDADAKVAEPVA